MDFRGYTHVDADRPHNSKFAPLISIQDVIQLRYTYRRGHDWSVVEPFREDQFVLSSLDRWTRFIVDPKNKYYSNSVLVLKDVREAILSADRNLSNVILRIILDLYHPSFSVHTSLNSLIKSIKVNDDIRRGRFEIL